MNFDSQIKFLVFFLSVLLGACGTYVNPRAALNMHNFVHCGGNYVHRRAERQKSNGARFALHLNGGSLDERAHLAANYERPRETRKLSLVALPSGPSSLVPSAPAPDPAPRYRSAASRSAVHAR